MGMEEAELIYFQPQLSQISSTSSTSRLNNIMNSYPFIIQSCEYWPLSMWVWSLHSQTIITRQMTQKVCLQVSLPAINSRFGLSSSSTLSLCTWHTTTLFRRSGDMVALSQVLNHLRALKLLSASQEDAGTTNKSLSRASTCSNSPRTSTSSSLSTSAASLLQLNSYFLLNSKSTSFQLRVLVYHIIHLPSEEHILQFLQILKTLLIKALSKFSIHSI